MYDIYEDYTMDGKDGLAGNTKDDNDPAMATGLYREVPTSEVNDNYVNTLVMLPRGNSYARGKVIVQKRDANENTFRRTYDNPYLPQGSIVLRLMKGRSAN